MRFKYLQFLFSGESSSQKSNYQRQFVAFFVNTLQNTIKNLRNNLFLKYLIIDLVASQQPIAFFGNFLKILNPFLISKKNHENLTDRSPVYQLSVIVGLNPLNYFKDIFGIKLIGSILSHHQSYLQHFHNFSSCCYISRFKVTKY